MHQPLIPAGGGDLRTAEIISNLKQMMESASDEQRYNAGIFRWCYKRMGEFIPQLVDEGKQPRVMLDYSGTLLWGLQQMGARRRARQLAHHHLRAALSRLRRVAWLGLGPSCRAVDAGAGLSAACARLAAPFRRAVRPGGACARARLLARRDGAAQPSGRRLRVRQDAEGMRLPLGAGAGAHGRAPGDGRRARQQAPAASAGLPQFDGARPPRSSPSSRRRAATPSSWRRCSPITKRAGFRGWDLQGDSVPPLVTQIADGENGGVMMNEFPAKYMEVVRECSGSDTPVVNVTEYLEHLLRRALARADLAGPATGLSGAHLGPLQAGRRRRRSLPM